MKDTLIQTKCRTPQEAVRAFCVGCAGKADEVKSCGGDQCLNGACDDNGTCWFYPYRMNKARPSVKLIRKMCLFCMGDSADLVRECSTAQCPLHQFRHGKNPNRAGVGGKNLPPAETLSRGLAAQNRFSGRGLCEGRRRESSMDYWSELPAQGARGGDVGLITGRKQAGSESGKMTPVSKSWVTFFFGISGIRSAPHDLAGGASMDRRVSSANPLK
jgi:hypothetical protein